MEQNKGVFLHCHSPACRFSLRFPEDMIRVGVKFCPLCGTRYEDDELERVRKKG